MRGRMPAAPGLALCGCLWLALCLPGAQAPLGAETLSFESALELALRQSPVLELERSAVRRAELSLGEARARLGPELSVSASASYLTNPPEGVTVTAGELGSFTVPAIPPALPTTVSIPEQDITFLEPARSTQFQLGLKLSQPLFAWGKLSGAAQLAGLDVELARVRLQQRQRQLRRELEKHYFSALLARESLAPLQRMAEALEEIRADQARSVELGASTELSLLAIESRQAAARSRLLEAQAGYRSALEGLAFYTGLEPGQIELGSWFREELPAVTEQELAGRAESGSPELAEAALQLQQARRGVALARGGAAPRPDLALSVAMQLTGQAVPWSEEGWEDTWDLNVIFSVGTQGTLFDSGRSGKQVGQAEEAVAAAVQAVELRRRELRLRLSTALAALPVRHAQVAEKRAALREAQEAERNARESFAQQLATRQELLGAEVQRITKELELLGSLNAFEAALADVEQLAGVSLTDRSVVSCRSVE
jgi:outer membrane protein